MKRLWIAAPFLLAACSTKESPSPAPAKEVVAPKPCPPEKPFALPAHTQLIDPDLWKAACVAPGLVEGLRCFNLETATAVVRTKDRGERYGWVGVRCKTEHPSEVAKAVESARQRYVAKVPWNTPSSFCRDVGSVLYTVVIEPTTSPNDARVLAGNRTTTDETLVKGGASETRAIDAGVKLLEKQLGATLDLVTFRESKSSGSSGLDDSWGFEGKIYSDL